MSARPSPPQSRNSARTGASQVKIRVLLRDTIAMGPGKASLLAAVDATGSISAAARQMGMSYRRAWMLIADMNACFVAPVVETAKGGERGGGARMTPFGRDVLARYIAIEAKANRSIKTDVARFASLMNTG